jgi:hypothetical protein
MGGWKGDQTARPSSQPLCWSEPERVVPQPNGDLKRNRFISPSTRAKDAGAPIFPASRRLQVQSSRAWTAVLHAYRRWIRARETFPGVPRTPRELSRDVLMGKWSGVERQRPNKWRRGRRETTSSSRMSGPHPCKLPEDGMAQLHGIVAFQQPGPHSRCRSGRVSHPKGAPDVDLMDEEEQQCFCADYVQTSTTALQTPGQLPPLLPARCVPHPPFGPVFSCCRGDEESGDPPYLAL